MKKRLTAALLALALLLPALGALPVSAADGTEGTVLYHREATGDKAENQKAWVGNSNNYWIQTCTTEHLGKLNQMCWYNNRTDAGVGLPEGETMEIVIPDLNVPTKGYAAVILSLQYARCAGNSDLHIGGALSGSFELYASTDGGQTWSRDYAGCGVSTMVDTGTTSNNLAADIYRVESADIARLVPDGAVINALKLRPYGDWLYHYGATRIQWIDVTGYDEAQAADLGAAPIPVGEQTMRQIVVARAHRTASLPWTCPTDVETRSPGVEESMAIHYPAGYQYQGPCYTRRYYTTWERFRSCVTEDGVYTGGTDYLTVEGMDCIRFVLDALDAVTTDRRNNWPRLVWMSNIRLLGALKTEPFQYTDEVTAANGAQEMYEAYALLQPGDYAAHYYPNTSPTASEDYVWHIRVVTKPTTVVRNKDGTIDPAKSYAYFDEITSASECFWRTPEGQTVTWTGKDPAAYQAEHPDYECIFCRACRVEKPYSFSTLRSTSYLPYTLREYALGQVESERLRTVLYADAASVREEGFAPIYNSNYRIVRLETRLAKARGGESLWEEEVYPNPSIHEYAYRSDELDALLAGLPRGRYLLTADVTAGPVTEVDGSQPVTRAAELAVTVGVPGDLTGDDKANGKDAVMFQRYLAGGYGLALDAEWADLNGDGKANGKDAVMLQRFVAGGYGVELN